MTLTPEKIEFYRKNPTVAARHLLNVKLCWYQRQMLKAFWFHRNTIWRCSRGAAKSFVGAVALLLLAMLYRKVKIGIVAGSVIQANEVLGKIEEIAIDAPFLEQELKSPIKINPDEGNLIKFLNGSWISTFPLIEKRRGRRLNVLMIDEYRAVDDKLVNSVAMPMLNIKHAEIDNKVLIASSGSYDNNPFYFKSREYEKMIEKGSKDYAICVFDIDDVRTSGYVDEEKVKNDMATFLPEEVDQEYYAKFTSLREGWIRATDIRAAQADFVPVMRGAPDREFIAGVDCARTEGGDNTAIAVFEVNPAGIKLVRVVALNGVDFLTQAITIRQICKDFNIVKLRMDYEQGGRAVQDNMVNALSDPRDGLPLPIIVPDDDYNTQDAKRIIQNIKFKNQDLVWNMGLDTKRAIQERVLLFPQDDMRIALTEDEESLLSQDEREAIELHREINAAKRELTMVKVKPNEDNTSFKFVVDNPKVNKKDRFTAVILGCSCAYEYWKEITSTDDSEIGAFWG